MIMQKSYQSRGPSLLKVSLNLSYIWQFVMILIMTIFVQVADVSAQATSNARHKITGKVISELDNQPIPGASILVKGTTIGTTSNSAGEFSIDAATGSNIIVSSVGYKAVTIRLSGKTNIQVALPEDVANLSEVVVVGYGSMKKTDLSSSQISVSAADIKKTVNTTIDQALQGRAANVYVTSNSGRPGGGVSVNIRGISTIGGNTEPLYVIDGVQILPGASTVTSSPLASLNPEDVESINVLQGPSAQAIYGSRSANGVVVITTKRGKSGETKITYSTTYGVQSIPKLLPTMNLREFAVYQNAYNKALNRTPQPEYADPSLLGDGTNWQKELFQSAPMSKHQLSLSGGNEKTTFYISGEYMKQEGIAIESGFDRYSVRTNVDNKVRNWLKVGANLSLSGTNEKISVTDDDLINTAITQSPAVAVRNADGSFDGPSQTQFRLSNPVALASINENRFKRTMLLGGVNAEFNLLKDLVFRTEFNGNIEYSTRYKFSPSYKFGGFVNESSTSERTANNSLYWGWNQTLRYNKKFGHHDLGLMVGHEAQQSTYESLFGSRVGYISNNITELSAGNKAGSDNGSSRGQWATESYFSRFNYTFNDKYILQATLRADGAAVFGPNKRWGYFPSVSAAWRISKEDFMKDITFIDDLKIRAEYGLTGNQSLPNGGTAIYSALNAWQTAWGTGFLTGRIANPDFQWESTKTYNLGFDLHALKNRLEIIVDAYIKNTDNLILELPLAAYMGTSGTGSISSPYVNIGSMKNTGFGITINTVNIESPFTWKSGISFSLDRNELSKLYLESSNIDRSPWFMNQFISRSVVGQPLWQFYGYKFAGIFQNYTDLKNSAIPETSKIDPAQGTWVGDVKFTDVNGDGVINEKDRTFVGSPWPKFIFGISNNFSYKNFDLSVFMQGTYGNSIFNYTKYANSAPERSGPGRGALQAVANFAQPSSYKAEDNPVLLNPGTTVPRVVAGDPNGNNRPTDQFIEDGSYLRVKNITLGYNVPKSILKKIPVRGLRVTAGVQNAFTITNYSGYDPEIGASSDKYGGNLTVGIDYGRYPAARMYTFSLTADF
ncbi:SusC/RagA family TonB-linked outer membrane protein [Pseudarcicella hirudinis]|nr:TonB-dependent receptor [Pseudarcicella hirudinis]